MITPARVRARPSTSSPLPSAPSSTAHAIDVENEDEKDDQADEPQSLQDAVARMLGQCESDEVVFLGLYH